MLKLKKKLLASVKFFKMIKIKNLKIGKNAKPVIIAEMSGITIDHLNERLKL